MELLTLGESSSYMVYHCAKLHAERQMCRWGAGKDVEVTSRACIFDSGIKDRGSRKQPIEVHRGEQQNKTVGKRFLRSDKNSGFQL